MVSTESPSKSSRLLWLVAIAALAFIPACGGRGGTESAPENRDLEALLSVARTMRDIGLPEVALSECRHIIESADPSEEALIAEALYLSGDCELDRNEVEAAMGHYGEVAARFAGEKGRALRQVAEALLRLGKWEEALSTLQAVDRAMLDDVEREKYDGIIGKIMPVTQMRVSGSGAFSKYVETGEDADFRFENWVVRSPLHFEKILDRGNEHGRIRIHIQKGMGGLWHPLPWKGGSFRLSIRFRIDAVDHLEHQISGCFGIANRKYFAERADAPLTEEDSLCVRIRCITHVEGEHRTRPVMLERNRSFEKGTKIKTQGASLLLDAPLDVWFRVHFEYSRELASMRVRTVQSRGSGEDLTLSDIVLRDITPFGEGPFFLFFGENTGGGDGLRTMELSVDHIRFEAHEEIRAPEPVASRRDLYMGNLHFFNGELAAALDRWEKAVREDIPNRGVLRFLMWKAAFLSGDREKASALDAEMIEKAKEFRPSEVDAIDCFGRFDPDAERFLPRLKAAISGPQGK